MIELYSLEQTEADVPSHDDWLSAPEISRLRSFRFPKRRSEWRLGRWTVKQAVCSYLQNCPEATSLTCVELRPEASGAPLLFVRNQQADISVSLSHRDGASFCVITPSATLGCDLERVEPRSDNFAADFFTDGEYAAVCTMRPADRDKLVTLIWSAKESALKALHAGLRLDTRSVEVVPTNPLQTCTVDTWHPLLVRSAASNVFHGWWRLAEGFIRTVVSVPPPFPPIALVPTNLTNPVRLIA